MLAVLEVELVHVVLVVLLALVSCGVGGVGCWLEVAGVCWWPGRFHSDSPRFFVAVPVGKPNVSVARPCLVQDVAVCRVIFLFFFVFCSRMFLCLLLWLLIPLIVVAAYLLLRLASVIISRLDYTERTCCGSNYTNTNPEPSCSLDGNDADNMGDDSSDSRGEVVRTKHETFSLFFVAR